MARFREFWYNNVPGAFRVGRHSITRRQIQVYGGPSPTFSRCETCQESEWLSRVFQKNFSPASHKCATSTACRGLCSKQGDELWTHYHQNFYHAVGIDPTLDAPKCLCLFRTGSMRLYPRYFKISCDQWMINLRRQLAQACQIEVVKTLEGMQLEDYDFLFTANDGAKFEELQRRIPIPIVMYGHDMWKGKHQEVLNTVKPEFLLTPFPTSWRKNFRIPRSTKVVFYPLSASQFFTRPDLSRKKPIRLLVIGVASGARDGIYAPRIELSEQLVELKGQLANSGKKFHIVHSHLAGCLRSAWDGPTRRDGKNEAINYLNMWSKYLGSADFVIFGGCGRDSAGRSAKDMLLIKYYECLGSGAIPIVPVVPDLKRLGLKPMVHYIPLSTVWKKNERLVDILSQPQKFRHIAKAAVKWHKQNADRLLFDGFENLIQLVTKRQYPRRLIS